MSCAWKFPAADPTTIAPGISTAALLNCEVRWCPEFVNIVGQVDGDRGLFSVLPKEGARRGCDESRRPVPMPLFLLSDGSRAESPHQLRGSPAQSPPSTDEHGVAERFECRDTARNEERKRPSAWSDQSHLVNRGNPPSGINNHFGCNPHDANA